MSEQALGVAEDRNARLMTNDGAEVYLLALRLRRFCLRGWVTPQGEGGLCEVVYAISAFDRGCVKTLKPSRS